MIYTSYFANIKNLPKYIVPIAICEGIPKWYTGKVYKKLAPKYEFFKEWKDDHDNEKYIKGYKEQVTDVLNAHDVVKDLLIIARNYKGLAYMPDICLICYEKPGDFCHRHLVSKWFVENGIDCEEY